MLTWVEAAVTYRYTIALGALLLVALTATWYLLGAPSRGSAVEPGATGLVVNAVRVGSGGWVYYQLNLSNLGDQDWVGDVRLIDRQPVAPGSQSQNLPGLPLPVPAAVGQGRVPSTTPDAALLAHLALPSRHQRIVYLPGSDRYTTVELVGRGGQVLYGAPIESSRAVPLAVLSDVETAASGLAAVHLGDLPIKVLSFSRSTDFPNSVIQLAAFAAVVVDQFDLSTLSRSQLTALRDYVGLGGSLIVAAGASWRRTLLPLPSEMSPLRPTATLTEPLQAVTMLVDGLAAPTAAVASGSLAPGAVVTLPGDPAPLMAELAYGGGRVVVLAFDPGADPVQGTKLAATAWTESLGRAVVKARSAQGWSASAIPGPSVAAAASLPQPPETPLPPPWLLACGLVVYLLLIGPLNLALSRLLGRPHLLWLTIPGLAIAASAAFYLAGGLLQGGTSDQQLQVIRVGPNGAVAQIEYHELLFNQRGQHRIEASTNALISPMTLGVYQWSVESCPTCAVQLRGLPSSVGEHAVTGNHPTVIEDGVVHGNVRVVGAATSGHAALGLDARLVVVQGRIQGKLANLSDRALAAVLLYTFDGETYRRAELAPALAPGELIDVGAQPHALAGGGARPGGTLAGLADTVAQAALSADPQPIILAFMQPLKSKLLIDGAAAPAADLAILEQPVRITSADSLLRDWETVRLLGTAGDQQSGFTSAYDIEVPAGSSVPLALSFDTRQHASVEVFNWRTRAWRSGPWNPDPQNGVNRLGALAPEEVSGGIVRVRVREPRLTWGAFIQVQAA